MSKKILFILSVLVIGSMIFSACAPKTEPVEEPAEEEAVEPAEPTEELAVGIVLPTKDEPRWIQDQTRFQEKLSAAGYDVEILFSQADPSQEKANVETLITKGVKVIILCPHDSAAAAASAEAARAAGVTIISYDRLITDTEAVDYYVTFDSVAVGEAQAQYLVDKAEGDGNPLFLFAGAATDNNAFLFFEGAWNVLQPKIADGTFYIVNSEKAVELQDKAELTRDEMGEIIGQITTNWDFDDAKSLAEANLTSAAAEDKGDVFILAPNDGTARAIADAFGADTDVSSYVVSGQDAEIASVQYIIDGKQSMTVLKDVRNLVDDAIALAVSVVEGKSIETTGEYDNGVIMVPAKQSEVITVDQSNVQETIIDSGYWDASEFTGVEEAPEEEEELAGGGPYKACLVTDSAGIGDRSFNDAVWMGLEMAEADFGSEITYIESKSADDYAPNLQACIDAESDVVICVGFMMGDACLAAVDANPDTKFVGVDIYGFGKPNFIGIDAYMEQSSFLAGYLAAGMTETGKLGTWTGFPGPVVLSFMDGFYMGAMEYNTVHGTEVEVLGYDPADMENAANIGSWDDTDKGRAISETQMDNGADIIYGVCGNVSTAAAAAMQERGYGYIFGMDQDWTITNPQYTDQILGSALKNMHVAVHEVMKNLEVSGTFNGGEDYILTLANGGTSLALNETIDIPAELLAEVEALEEKISSGEITGASEEFYTLYRSE